MAPNIHSKTNGMQTKLGEVARFTTPPPVDAPRHSATRAIAPWEPPRFIDFTLLSDGEIRDTLDRLIAYGRDVYPVSLVIRVDARFAREFFSRGENIRPESDSTIDQYARAAGTGKYSLTGDTVKFTKTGRPGDGFHRMYGVEKSGAAIETFAVFGIEDEAIKDTDRGNIRAKHVVTGVTKKMGATCEAAGKLSGVVSRGAKLSIDETESLIALFRPSVDAIAATDGVHFNSKFAATFWSVLTVVHQRSPAKVCEFARQMCLPDTVEGVHPTVRLLRRFLRESNGAGSSNGWMSSLHTAVALRAFVAGRDAKLLRVKTDPKDAEDFDGVKGIANWIKGRP